MTMTRASFDPSVHTSGAVRIFSVLNLALPTDMTAIDWPGIDELLVAVV